MSFLTDGISKILRRRKREQKLAAAPEWPTTQAKLLAAVIVDKDVLAEGTLAQDRQLEIPYYFSLGSGAESGLYSGYVRTVAMSDGEARRLGKQIADGTTLMVRYNPANPDEGCVLTRDNPGLSFNVWEG
jgi:hypothetical protein